jgi:phage-related protein
MAEEKPIVWVGSSRRDLRAFPDEARTRAGRALSRVQRGGDPPSWKPMPAVGSGSREIRISTMEGGRVEHRVFYVATFPEAVYVLHAFRKTTAATSRRDVELGRQRYGDMLAYRKERMDSHDR